MLNDGITGTPAAVKLHHRLGFFSHEVKSEVSLPLGEKVCHPTDPNHDYGSQIKCPSQPSTLANLSQLSV